MFCDKLASGASSATFTGPKIKFDDAEMRRNLRHLPAATFMENRDTGTSRRNVTIGHGALAIDFKICEIAVCHLSFRVDVMVAN